jgi:hypothetical protein
VLIATLRTGGESLVAASTCARTDWQACRQRLPISIAYLRLAL